MTVNADHLIWIDLEMTGLDPDKDKIIEIATIVTDSQLNIVAEGPNLVIYQSSEIMNAMDEWCTKQHALSGLTQKVLESHVNEREAEKQTLAFLKQFVKPRYSPMCGNTICQDRRFLYRNMPELEAFFHYRHLDVSTVKELAKRWMPKIYNSMEKEAKHLALEDIKESIEELKYYRQHFFIIPEIQK
ncbi:MAG TPA: oligoribonuclease [Gammaproteobacteria bacterium]|nr:oligoribonuclease [Gammaproteobacteria bacterium]